MHSTHHPHGRTVGEPSLKQSLRRPAAYIRAQEIFPLRTVKLDGLREGHFCTNKEAVRRRQHVVRESPRPRPLISILLATNLLSQSGEVSSSHTTLQVNFRKIKGVLRKTIKHPLLGEWHTVPATRTRNSYGIPQGKQV
ncbi:hypothetical protein J6590_015426 [Homalodisca vitripennis]|nr:hypothetical protein J6590_015426 [Homalodisca vitripennis]